jgi:hypothetical protein
MRRLIPLLLVLAAAATAALVLGAASGRAAADNCSQGSATGTFTCTMHGPMPTDLGPGCGQADAVINGNGVFHITVNKAGDAWATGTVQGAFTTYDASNNVTGTGHAQQWFGLADNNQNGVQHFTANGYANMLDGSRLTFHAAGQFTVNANGVVTVNNTTMTCN